jgi:hypothetical protein
VAFKESGEWGGFLEQIGDEVPEGAIFKPPFQGLRSTAVVRRRQAGYTAGQISNDIGMRIGTVMRYSRFMDPRETAAGHIVVLEGAGRKRQKKALWDVDTAEGNN